MVAVVLDVNWTLSADPKTHQTFFGHMNVKMSLHSTAVDRGNNF